jgi:hypothetical protein
MKNHLRCTGWWEQGGIGREEMEGLLMQLTDGKITGSGYDVVGIFTFDGVLDADNQVQMLKFYMGQHTVLYRGQYDGKNRMWGNWQIGWMSGPWEIVFRDGEEGIETQERESAAATTTE